MTELQIRKKFLAHPDNVQYVWWWPYKRAFPSKGRILYLDQDIHNCWDAMGIQDSDTRFIQITTTSNLAARRKKILSYFEEHSVFVPTEIWAWDDKKRSFKVEHL